jgi:hypothetical protein
LGLGKVSLAANKLRADSINLFALSHDVALSVNLYRRLGVAKGSLFRFADAIVVFLLQVLPGREDNLAVFVQQGGPMGLMTELGVCKALLRVRE